MSETLSHLDDLAALSQLNDDTLNAALKSRYAQNIIYTNVGEILVSVNPFKTVAIYGPDYAHKYTNTSASHGPLPPHIYWLADRSFSNMNRNQHSQVCVISGESGAGKTEAAKLFIKQVVLLSSSISSLSSNIEVKINMINPILEAFGNAQTNMNNNSSRFGKYVELLFNDMGSVIGASISHYLLEKSRVVLQASGEGSFHIFYYLLYGSSAMIPHLRLSDPEAFLYLSSFDERNRNQCAQMWLELQRALGELGFVDDERTDITRILAGILHLGNVEFTEDGDSDKPLIADQSELRTASACLHLQEADLAEALMINYIHTKSEVIEQHRDAAKCVNVRDATAKALYGALFTWIVERIDKFLKPAEQKAVLQIGILDIFGFEHFQVNSFEQLCINLANEQLQFFFNQHIFSQELSEYESEGISSVHVLFKDNQPTLELFVRKPLGLFALLDEESRFPKGTDATFVEKLKVNLSSDGSFGAVPGRYSFAINHYAGTVVYNAENFLEKNRDLLPNEITSLLAESGVDLVRVLFGSPEDIPGLQSRSRSQAVLDALRFSMKRKGRNSNVAADRASRKGKAGKRKSIKANVANGTVSSQFKTSLSLLIQKMNVCQPHFVRCLKPNAQQQPDRYESSYVLKQLAYTGMLETTRIRREGFAYRPSFDDFFTAFRVLVYEFTDKKVKPSNPACTAIMNYAVSHYVPPKQGAKNEVRDLSGWQVGKTKVFLRYWHYDILSSMVNTYTVRATTLQKYVRRFLARKKYVPILRNIRVQEKEAASFLFDMVNQIKRLRTCLETLQDEDNRRGLDGLEQAADKKPEAELKFDKLDNKAQLKEKGKLRRAVLKWWIKYERVKGVHTDDNGKIQPWFHGLISRADSEEFLASSALGTYLIRISERYNGYALSFRFGDRVRHYKLCFSPNGGYQIEGLVDDFGTLEELVEYYRHVDISEDGDRLGMPLDLDHDLNLGIDLDGYIDPMGIGKKRPAHEARPRAASMHSTVAFEMHDRGSERYPDSKYLDNGVRPPWFHGQIDRTAAEEMLSSNGMFDGSFLVREKLHSSNRVVVVLSLVSAGYFRHHLLERREDKSFVIDGEDIPPGCYSLQACITQLQSMRHPTVTTVLSKYPVTVASAAAPPVPKRDSRRFSTHSDLSPTPPPAPLAPPAPMYLCSGWTSSQVVAWLRSIRMGGYAGLFEAQHINGDALARMTQAQVERFISSKSDAKILMQAINNLNLSPTSAAPPLPDVKNIPKDHHKTDYVVRRRFLFFKVQPPEGKLRHACKNGDFDEVVRLLSFTKDIKVDAVRVGGSGKTALFCAAERGYLQIVNKLLEFGASVSRKSADGVSPIDAAAANGEQLVVIALKQSQQMMTHHLIPEARTPPAMPRRQHEPSPSHLQPHPPNPHTFIPIPHSQNHNEEQKLGPEPPPRSHTPVEGSPTVPVRRMNIPLPVRPTTVDPVIADQLYLAPTTPGILQAKKLRESHLGRSFHQELQAVQTKLKTPELARKEAPVYVEFAPMVPTLPASPHPSFDDIL